jgi:hypothetical protein
MVMGYLITAISVVVFVCMIGLSRLRGRQFSLDLSHLCHLGTGLEGGSGIIERHWSIKIVIGDAEEI